jgi:hypothetical protein
MGERTRLVRRIRAWPLDRGGIGSVENFQAPSERYLRFGGAFSLIEIRCQGSLIPINFSICLKKFVPDTCFRHLAQPSEIAYFQQMAVDNLAVFWKG